MWPVRGSPGQNAGGFQQLQWAYLPIHGLTRHGGKKGLRFRAGPIEAPTAPSACLLATLLGGILGGAAFERGADFRGTFRICRGGRAGRAFNRKKRPANGCTCVSRLF